MRFALLLSLVLAAALAQELHFAELGDLHLTRGGVIRDCRIGYRTFGQLNADHTNAILFPTWANGTTDQLKDTIAAFNLSSYYVIAVDALSNGVSSSPSNSAVQPRMHFPQITIADMVESQYVLLSRILQISHLRAVLGISMGGMQTFQWMVSHPDFMGSAIPIVGSPRVAAYDLLQWQTQLDALMDNSAWKNGDYVANFSAVSELEFGAILLTTPEHFNQHTTRQEVLEQLRKARGDSGGVDVNDKIRQVQAMMSLDVSQQFGGSMEAAAAAVKAKVLVIVSGTDHVVTPGPALDFARHLHAEVLVLDNDCGHLAPGCEQQRVTSAVHRFLEH